MKNPKIQIYIMSKDRVLFFKNTLNSIINQICNVDFEVIISDNSETDDVMNLVNSQYKDIKYIRRTPVQLSPQHSVSIRNEISSEYFMIFHDDDIMMPGMVQSLYDEIKQTGVVATGVNSIIFNESHGEAHLTPSFFGFNNKYIRTKESFLRGYFLGNGIAPYPGYMYRKSAYIDNNLVPRYLVDNCKYTDFIFLMEGLRYGTITWIAEPKMFYRIHVNNDSAEFKIDELNIAIDYICKHTKYTHDSIYIKLYIIHNYFRIFIDNLKKRDRNNHCIDFIESKVVLKKYLFVVLFIKIPLAIYFKIVRKFFYTYIFHKKYISKYYETLIVLDK
jgi:hypothetical protein